MKSARPVEDVDLETGREIILRVTRDDGKVETALVPRPSCGWGGGEAVLSPKRNYVAVVWDSGQHDAGYELFALEPEVRRITGLPGIYGTGAILAFSPDDGRLAMLSGIEPRLESREHDEEQEIEWAELRARTLPDGPIEVCSVVTTMPPIATEGSTFYYPKTLRFTSPNTLAFAGPTGALIALELPLPRTIEVEPPPLRPYEPRPRS